MWIKAKSPWRRAYFSWLTDSLRLLEITNIDEMFSDLKLCICVQEDITSSQRRSRTQNIPQYSQV